MFWEYPYVLRCIERLIDGLVHANQRVFSQNTLLVALTVVWVCRERSFYRTAINSSATGKGGPGIRVL